MKIFIDPGHGGSSIGATYKGRKEQDDCLRLSLKIEEFLLK
jgi:N-acetylmuramoyl-L-alanine amidase